MSVQTREQEFHDALAATLGSEGLAVRGPDELEDWVLNRVGPLDRRRVLDLGCGSGELTFLLAARGAHVTALDISPGMIELAAARVAQAAPDAEVEFVTAPAEDTGLPAASFDLIIGKWILHHIDVDAAVPEMGRLLRSGGRAVLIENSATNRLLSFARKWFAGRFGIPRYGTHDEHPLTDADYALLAREFDYFRLSFPDFFFFRLFDRQVLRYRYPAVSRAARRADDYVWHEFESLRRYSYHVVLEVGKGT